MLPLQWMAKDKDSNRRITWWFLSLQDFSFQVKNQAGVHHKNTNGISKMDILRAQFSTPAGLELRGFTVTLAGSWP